MREYEVRATGVEGKKIFRVVRASSENDVKQYFSELCFTNIYVQEVTLSDCFSLDLTVKNGTNPFQWR